MIPLDGFSSHEHYFFEYKIYFIVLFKAWSPAVGQFRDEVPTVEVGILGVLFFLSSL